MAVQIHGEDGRVARMLESIFMRAHQARASDIHFESLPSSFRIRFRIDGLLHEQTPIPRNFRAAVISRLKVQAGLDISEKRLPQDGAFTELLRGERINCRLSTFPGESGEKVVVRLLSRIGAHELGDLGMEESMAQRLYDVVSRPQGMVLVTGPTGCGKTSTLYSLLRHLESPQVNIMTLEDPIEYRFKHITQGQTNAKAGFSFARGLRATLRQDPDIIMVGEMRDFETADVALKAALTGHLVLSSLHTNSAVETVIRLIDMGLERFVVAAALRAIVGQRLVRLLCERCREPMEPDARTLELLGVEACQQPIYRESGCHGCNHSGFSGRTALFELVRLDQDLSDLIKLERSGRKTLKREIAQRGIRSLRQAGYAAVLAGRTSLPEVFRVC